MPNTDVSRIEKITNRIKEEREKEVDKLLKPLVDRLEELEDPYWRSMYLTTAIMKLKSMKFSETGYINYDEFRMVIQTLNDITHHNTDTGDYEILMARDWYKVDAEALAARVTVNIINAGIVYTDIIPIKLFLHNSIAVLMKDNKIVARVRFLPDEGIWAFQHDLMD